MCFYVLIPVFIRMFLCKTSMTQIVFTTVVINYIFILSIIVFIFFFSHFYTIVPLLMTKFLFEISFMITKIWIRCCCIHFWEWSITNLVSWMLFYSLLGMKHNQFDLMIFHQKLIVLFSHKKVYIIWEYLWNNVFTILLL